MSSLDKMLEVLDLFSETRSAVTAEQVAEELSLSRATAYRYLTTLTKSGLLSPGAGSSWVLGGRVIILDRLMRMSDPLLTEAKAEIAVMHDQVNGVLLLCSFYGDKVLCIHQHRTSSSAITSYTRGRPMPLFRGATSRIILAHLPPYQLRNLVLHRHDEIEAAGLGNNWETFRDRLAGIRKRGYEVGLGEVDAGMVGVAAPIFRGKAIAACLSAVVTDDEFKRVGAEVLAQVVMRAAQAIGQRITPPDVKGNAVAPSGFPSTRGIAQPART
ncbi:IclR family transcriptional regulator [Polaromonas sp.]|uniref:IclR family transcriptional regulator n=1 Tax=Polaromonas sp. TaxID=1869339 RepID=UPI001D961C8F|nr:IclR family transcriptional regulator [Polaromonas sp.]MBT9476171.1 IclR family transcriptional regulator [Polaromonas sp.]